MVEGRGKMIDEQAHHITRHIKGTCHFKSDLTKKTPKSVSMARVCHKEAVKFSLIDSNYCRIV